MPTLQLLYAFTPDPKPIRASAVGANPSVIDLQVMISNDLTAPVIVSGINIEIPVHEDDARSLSSGALPPPQFDAARWQIALDGSGSVITIRPVTGATIRIGADPILFTLPGIKVNQTPSARVPITISEFSPSGTKSTDNTTYALAKEPSELLVTSFHASPDTLNDLNESTRLFWACTDQGKGYTYRLRADDSTHWQPRDCVGDGNCFTWQDGVAGVPTVPLNPLDEEGVITFKLDAIQTNGGHGNRSVYQTMMTQVQVGLPRILGNTRVTQLHGGLVRLHWVAVNAARCSVQLEDGTLIADNAPVNTYDQGYTIILPGAPGIHRITVTAFAASGGAQYPYTFPDIVIKPPVALPASGAAVGIAATPNGLLGLAVNWSNAVTLIDLATQKVKGSPIAVDSPRTSVATSPDGRLAFVFSRTAQSVTVIDLVTGQAEAKTIPAVWPSAAAFTPDGKLALVVSLTGVVTVIDVAARTAEAATIQAGITPTAIAITPDGALALVMNNDGCDVTVIDISARKARPATIPVHAGPTAVAITPDGTLALVVANNECVTVIDLADPAMPVKAAVPVGGDPSGVAITSDSRLALVGDFKNNQIIAIELPSLTVVPGRIPVAAQPLGVALAPDDSIALVADFRGGSVIML